MLLPNRRRGGGGGGEDANLVSRPCSPILFGSVQISRCLTAFACDETFAVRRRSSWSQLGFTACTMDSKLDPVSSQQNIPKSTETSSSDSCGFKTTSVLLRVPKQNCSTSSEELMVEGQRRVQLLVPQLNSVLKWAVCLFTAAITSLLKILSDSLVP